MKFPQWKPSKGGKFNPTNVSFASETEPPVKPSDATPKLDLAASKTFQEEEEEPEVEINISRSGQPFILDEGERQSDAAQGNQDAAAVVPAKPRRFNFLGLSRSKDSSPSSPSTPSSTSPDGSSRKLPVAMPGWTKNSLQGWSRRERILLCIAVLNTMIVIGLLGSNMHMVRQRRNQTSVSAASREVPMDAESGKGGKGKGGKEGKSGKGKKDSDDQADDDAAGAESEQEEASSNSGGTFTSGTGGWQVSTNSSLAGGPPPANTNPGPSPPANNNPGPAPVPATNPTDSVPAANGGSSPSVSSTSGQAQPTAVALGDPSSLCGCPSCTQAVWNEMAGPYTCGDRISYLANEFPLHYPTQVHACRQIAFEFPCVCGGCDPGRCGIGTSEFNLPGNWVPPTKDRFGQEVTPAPTPVTAVTSTGDQKDLSLYCFPSPEARTTYTMWGGMIVQPKEDAGVCGPGNNRFTSANVIVDQAADTLTLVHTGGTASEVRILLPPEQRPYTYGTYSFSVQSVAVKDASGKVLSNLLPKEIILGLFTWDDTEKYALRENYNHEVDIEISRWNCENNSDLQYLVQPPGFPQMHRLFSGDADATNPEDKYKQGGQVYSFLWNPARIDWTSTAGNAGNNEFSLKSEEAVFRNVPDYIQCLPDRGGNMEVRINLWNFLGAVPPAGLSSSARVEVVIDNFSFTPSAQTFVADGGVCTKHCHCQLGVSQCIRNICTRL